MHVDDMGRCPALDFNQSSNHSPWSWSRVCSQWTRFWRRGRVISGWLVTLLLWNNERWLSSSPEVVIVTRGAYRHRPKRGDGTKCCSTHDLASNQLDFHIVIYNKDFQYWDSLCYPRKIFERMYLQPLSFQEVRILNRHHWRRVNPFRASQGSRTVMRCYM